MSITVKTINADEYLTFVTARGQTSFLQLSTRGKVKPEWRLGSIGSFNGDTLAGVGLVLYRQLPKLSRYLAYLSEGPVLNWDRPDVDAHLEALVAHARRNKALAVWIGPTVIHHRWLTLIMKVTTTSPRTTALSQVILDETTLTGTRVLRTLDHLDWQPQAESHGFVAGQPKFNYQLRLTDAEGTAPTDEQLPKDINQLWCRNAKKADKLGVTVIQGEHADLARFHRIYLETTKRGHLVGRGPPCFRTMWDALNAEEPDRTRVYLAEYEDDLVAATAFTHVGTHAQYSYGISTTMKREVHDSSVVQRHMIRDARDAGADIYDLRGIIEDLAADDPELGLIQFRVGTGGEAVAYLGEWSKPISSFLHFASQQYLKRWWYDPQTDCRHLRPA